MIRLKSESDIRHLRESGRILARLLRELQKRALAGTKLKDLDLFARKFLAEAGAEPAFLNYQPTGAEKGFPAAICTSVNEVVVHGLPDSYILKSGDLLTLDAGVKYRGYFTDAAITVPIGKVSEEAMNLKRAAEVALEAAIRECYAGKTLGDIGAAIEEVAEEYGVQPVEGLTGHGVGFAVHEDPSVHNFGKRGTGYELKSGLVIAIEPMFTTGSGNIVQNHKDEYETEDSALSSHHEHTIVITEGEPEILTK
jgi:methionyl aminopeptidase